MRKKDTKDDGIMESQATQFARVRDALRAAHIALSELGWGCGRYQLAVAIDPNDKKPCLVPQGDCPTGYVDTVWQAIKRDGIALRPYGLGREPDYAFDDDAMSTLGQESANYFREQEEAKKLRMNAVARVLPLLQEARREAYTARNGTAPESGAVEVWNYVTSLTDRIESALAGVSSASE